MNWTAEVIRRRLDRTFVISWKTLQQRWPPRPPRRRDRRVRCDWIWTEQAAEEPQRRPCEGWLLSAFPTPCSETRAPVSQNWNRPLTSNWPTSTLRKFHWIFRYWPLTLARCLVVIYHYWWWLLEERRELEGNEAECHPCVLRFRVWLNVKDCCPICRGEEPQDWLQDPSPVATVVVAVAITTTVRVTTISGRRHRLCKAATISVQRRRSTCHTSTSSSSSSTNSSTNSSITFRCSSSSSSHKWRRNRKIQVPTVRPHRRLTRPLRPVTEVTTAITEQQRRSIIIRQRRWRRWPNPVPVRLRASRLRPVRVVRNGANAPIREPTSTDVAANATTSPYANRARRPNCARVKPRKRYFFIAFLFQANFHFE